MNDILRDFLHKFVTIYFDDVFGFNPTLDEHLEHMRLARKPFIEGFNLHLKKCFFGLIEMECFGYEMK
jgi:hypothetical protein